MKWTDANKKKPKAFASVLGHMPDAGELPAVGECYYDGFKFFFPVLGEFRPVDYWTKMPELSRR